ncbi:hypothetical protein ACHQM5_029584 [Ranunculus cassubicifolius]
MPGGTLRSINLKEIVKRTFFQFLAQELVAILKKFTQVRALDVTACHSCSAQFAVIDKAIDLTKAWDSCIEKMLQPACMKCQSFLVCLRISFFISNTA